MLTNLRKRTFLKQNNQGFDNCNSINNFSINKSRNDNDEVVLKKFCINIEFELCDDLMYYLDKNNNSLRLCILKSIKKKIFKTIHDNNYYFDYYCCFIQINKTLFILKLLKKICVYVKHCFVYQNNQTKRYRLYDKLMSIFLKSYSFYIIVINYVIKLLNKYDCLLIIINKFNRRLQLISSYTINFAIV